MSLIKPIDQTGNQFVRFLTMDAGSNIYNRLTFRELERVKRTCQQLFEHVRDHPSISTGVARNEMVVEQLKIPPLINSLSPYHDNPIRWAIPYRFNESDLALSRLLLPKVNTLYFLVAMLNFGQEHPKVAPFLIRYCLCAVNPTNPFVHLLLAEIIIACDFLNPQNASTALDSIFARIEKMDDVRCKLFALFAFAQICPKLILKLPPEEVSNLLKKALDLSLDIETIVVFNTADEDDPNDFEEIVQDKKLALFKDRKEDSVVTLQGNLSRACAVLPPVHCLPALEHAFKVIENIKDPECKARSLEELAASAAALGPNSFQLLQRILAVLKRIRSFRWPVYEKVIDACPLLHSGHALAIFQMICGQVYELDDEEEAAEVLSMVLWGISRGDPLPFDPLLENMINRARERSSFRDKARLLAEASTPMAGISKERAARLAQEALEILKNSRLKKSEKPPILTAIFETLSLLDSESAYRLTSQVDDSMISKDVNLYYIKAKLCAKFPELRFQALFRQTLSHLEVFSKAIKFFGPMGEPYLEILRERAAQLPVFKRMPLLHGMTQVYPSFQPAAVMLTETLSDLTPYENVEESTFSDLIRVITTFSIPRDQKEGARLLKEAFRIAPLMAYPIAQACTHLENDLAFEALNQILDAGFSIVSIEVVRAASKSLSPGNALLIFKRILRMAKGFTSWNQRTLTLIEMIANATDRLDLKDRQPLLEELYELTRMVGLYSPTLKAILEKLIPLNPERAFEILKECSKEDKKSLKYLGRLPFWNDSLNVLKMHKKWGAKEGSYEQLAFLIASLPRFQK